MELKYLKDMKSRFIVAALLGMCYIPFGCTPEVLEGADDKVRVTLTPYPILFDSSGKTANGDSVYEGVVTVVKLKEFNTLDWEASLPANPVWVTMDRANITGSFTDIYSGNIYETVEKGLRISVAPNEEYKRKTTLRITVSDGTEQDFEIVQDGLKASATVSTATSHLDFMAGGQTFEIEWTSNMGDVYSYSAIYPDGSSPWLSWEDGGTGKVKLTAARWEDKENERTAIFRITVGSEDTSIAFTDISVRQLPSQDFYYIYGPSFGGVTLENSLQMIRKDVDLFQISGYIMNLGTGNNQILLSKDSREGNYPLYCLAANGKIVKIPDASFPVPDGPAVDIDGMRTITANFADLTWGESRISTPNAMPDSEVASYKTKSYPASDGSERIWMVEHFRWDGGEISPKLGSKMVFSEGGTATGGYTTAQIEALTWNGSFIAANEEKSVGGDLEGDDSHGRIYALSEVLTGEALYGIDHFRRAPFPDGWTLGSEVTDGVGNKVVIEYITPASLTGADSELEEAHPMLKWQIQGICPYGWHIANLNDWKELSYAVKKASEGASDYPVTKDITYKGLVDGIENVAPWLKSSEWSSGTVLASGADKFGFCMYPLGFRYMTQGYQQGGLSLQMWIPVWASETQAYRLGSFNKAAKVWKASAIDNGNAIMTFRCVKNYKQ